MDEYDPAVDVDAPVAGVVGTSRRGAAPGVVKFWRIVPFPTAEAMAEDAEEVADEGIGGRPITIGVRLCMTGVLSGGVGRFVRFFSGGCGAGVFGAGCGAVFATVEDGGLFK